MVPYKTSYDKNMIKMTMQDGNVVYTSLSSLVMMAKYQAMLTQLKGENVCLLLDASNSAIEKIDCSDLSNSKKKKKKKEETEETNEETNTEDNTSDDAWQVDEQTGLEYNATTGHYRDPTTLEEYIWNEQTQTFDSITQEESDQSVIDQESLYNSYIEGYDWNSSAYYGYE